MLTRLKVDGFKNLVDVDIHFGPFTCVAGANGVGKSNLFDAIRFLSALAEKPLTEAALSVRGEGGRALDLEGIFHRVGDRQDTEMRFEVEMLVPEQGVDHLGQDARAAITFLRYELGLALVEGALSLRKEELTHITLGAAPSHLKFTHDREWRRSVVKGRRTSAFISTKTEGGSTHVRLHQDQGSDYRGGGRPRALVADRLPRTVLSDVNAAESATAVLARQEMQSWRLLQLEPSALRAPDSYTSPERLATDGAHLPAALARLARNRRVGGNGFESPEAQAVFAGVANRLSELIDGVRSIRVNADDRRELLTLMLTDTDGTEHEARSLSDGTLRFLALAILESDPTAQGVLCLEEPENGIHPERIPAMLRLLRDLAVDPERAVGDDNPLRQVIVNTHSPVVVGQVRYSDLLVAVPEILSEGAMQFTRPSFRWLSDTWRERAWPEQPSVPPGLVISYLNPFEPPDSDASRVVDRGEIQLWLPGILTER